jgi:hypothetical protein
VGIGDQVHAKLFSQQVGKMNRSKSVDDRLIDLLNTPWTSSARRHRPSGDGSWPV